MKPIPIPIRAVSPGSQPPEDEALQYLEYPREVPVFSMPQVPESADRRHTAAARAVLAEFLELVRSWRYGDPDYPRIDVVGLDAGPREVLNQVLGEGEVGIKVNGGAGIHIQESVFAGVWREQHLDESGRVVHDYLQACGVPPVALEHARRAASPEVPDIPVPAGAMNSSALLRELRQQVAHLRPGMAPHVLNLTLLPLTPDDHVVLDAALGEGAVAIISRGFGNCRISSTRVSHVWRVQYFNSMNTLILNTVEVVEVPEVAAAAAEDLDDSVGRLGDLVAWMDEAYAA